MKKYAVIYNPNARNAGKLSVGEIVKMLDGAGVHPLVYQTAARGDGIILARKAVEDGASRIYPAGGDGTLNEVVSGLMLMKKEAADAGKEPPALAEVCPIPLGTVNVFARENGFSNDPREALASSFSAKASPMDIGACNDRFFIMMASVGFDGFVINEIENMIAGESKVKKIFGPLAYLIVGVRSLLKYDFPKLKITARSIFGEKEFFADFAVVSNTRFYGGKYVLSPSADARDGFLDLFMLNSREVKDYLRFFWQVVTKRYNFRGLRVRRYQVKECRVDHAAGPAECGVFSQIDGEIYNRPPLEIKIHEKALELVTLA